MFVAKRYTTMDNIIELDPHNSEDLENLVLSKTGGFLLERVYATLANMCAKGLIPEDIFTQIGAEERSVEFLMSVVKHYATQSRTTETQYEEENPENIRTSDFNDFETHYVFLQASGHKLLEPRASALFSALQDIFKHTWNEISLGLIEAAMDSEKQKLRKKSLRQFHEDHITLVGAIEKYPLKRALYQNGGIDFRPANAYGFFAWWFSRETLNYEYFNPGKN